MTHVTDTEVINGANHRTPSEKATGEIESVVNTKLGIGAYKPDQHEQCIRDDVLTLRGFAALEGTDILGMSLDTETGLINEIDV